MTRDARAGAALQHTEPGSRITRISDTSLRPARLMRVSAGARRKRSTWSRRIGARMSRRFSFGEFVLDRDTRELRRERHVVSISPKAFQLLEILLENQPKAMAKGMLQDLLWPNTFVVEKNLANLVGEIREALGDSAGNPRFVRTVPRFGYAFREAAAITVEQGAGALLGPIPQCRLTWSAGRAVLSDGDHIVGRDPDAELFLDSPSVSRRHAVDQSLWSTGHAGRPWQQERHVRRQSPHRRAHAAGGWRCDQGRCVHVDVRGDSRARSH